MPRYTLLRHYYSTDHVSVDAKDEEDAKEQAKFIEANDFEVHKNMELCGDLTEIVEEVGETTNANS